MQLSVYNYFIENIFLILPIICNLNVRKRYTVYLNASNVIRMSVHANILIYFNI